VHAKSHALRESALYDQYAVRAVADTPAPPRASADNGGASDDGAAGTFAGAGVTAPAPLAADAVAAELLKLFTAAKGLSRSVLLATEMQEQLGVLERQQAEWDPPDEGDEDVGADAEEQDDDDGEGGGGAGGAGAN
jgi:hypothetical protein